MKRVLQHPPKPLTGKRYWRSLGELSDTPEFREWLEREFPAGAAEVNSEEWSRRSFLKLMGASMALAGFGLNSCRRPETHSPTRERLRAELEKRFPRLRWVVYEPLLSEAQSFATELSFGSNRRLVPKLERADVILALDSDFLDCGQGDLASVRAFTSRRRVSSAKDN